MSVVENFGRDFMFSFYLLLFLFYLKKVLEMFCFTFCSIQLQKTRENGVYAKLIRALSLGKGDLMRFWTLYNKWSKKLKQRSG